MAGLGQSVGSLTLLCPVKPTSSLAGDRLETIFGTLQFLPKTLTRTYNSATLSSSPRRLLFHRRPYPAEESAAQSAYRAPFVVLSSSRGTASLQGIGNRSIMDNFSIQISSNLVKKLAEDAEKSKRKPRRTKKVPREPLHPQAKTTQKQGSDDSKTLKGPSAKAWPLQSPLFVPVTPPPSQSPYAELDAIRSVLQESKRVVEQLQKQDEKMLQEVTQKAKELRDKEFKLPFQKPMPCSNEKDACLSCYKEHADNPLKCAGVVKTFESCARRIRQEVGTAEK